MYSLTATPFLKTNSGALKPCNYNTIAGISGLLDFENKVVAVSSFAVLLLIASRFERTCTGILLEIIA